MLSSLSFQQQEMARQKGEVIRQDHLSLKTEFPSSRYLF